ncbi:unnamed protein product [Didymodactylos carnosus]|uniref:Uncharacterized protein n=1 Tax=Didymodactylos carnosus TaxID=1234261 RepID=A0A814C7A2_9BILA|nr:unnamed protein product [Didymodactylos carnosus]CAF3716018.1 unnamed protein product [Didymodactylos carnosus]
MRYSGISYTTLRASPSERVKELAKPKIKREQRIRQEFFDNFFNYGYSGVKKSALKATCSDRTARLACPKSISLEYVNMLPPSVTQTTSKEKTIHRSQELVRPKYNMGKH